MLVHTIEEVREQIKKWKRDGLTVGFVPTMGALHSGHTSLVEASVSKCDRTVVSIFVNPIQFAPGEDFDRYPRTLDKDFEMCKEAGVDLVFAPSASEMYGRDKCSSKGSLSANDAKEIGFILSNDFLTYVVPPYFYVDKLCGKSRPGHFDGVCTVVNKLFNIIQPDVAFFGQKDAQQFAIIKKMVQDLNIPVEPVSCPIVREKDGLAMSSRNKYLTPEQRKDALVLNKILKNIQLCYNKGIKDVRSLTETAYQLLNENHSLEYLEFRDKNDLERKESADNDTMVFIAVKIGDVRLIDNLLLEDES